MRKYLPYIVEVVFGRSRFYCYVIVLQSLWQSYFIWMMRKQPFLCCLAICCCCLWKVTPGSKSIFIYVLLVLSNFAWNHDSIAGYSWGFGGTADNSVSRWTLCVKDTSQQFGHFSISARRRICTCYDGTLRNRAEAALGRNKLWLRPESKIWSHLHTYLHKKAAQGLVRL